MQDAYDPNCKRVLVIDGYCFRGLGPLYVIDRIVKAASIRAKKVLRPCDLFDLICGTSSGALVAILIGRLGLDCDTAILEYNKLASACCGEDESRFWEDILTTKHVNASPYLAALSAIIAKYSGDLDPSMLISGAPGEPTNIRTTNTFVVVTSADPDFSNRAHCIRSYHGPKTSPPGHQWSVLEAARAASSNPFYLSPLLISDKYGFRDSAFSGFNNPINLCRREQKILWPNESKVLTVSLGTDTSMLVPESVGKNWEAWSVTDGYCSQFVDAILSKLKIPVTDSHRRIATHIIRQIASTAAETKAIHLEADDTLPRGMYRRIDAPLVLNKVALVDYFHRDTIKEAITRWEEGTVGKHAITTTSVLLADEIKEVTADDLRKMDPPPPLSGTVNPGYNPQLDKRRPEDVMDYLRNYRVLFIIDDSNSMRGKLWAETRDALSGIAEHALQNNAHEVSVAFINSQRIGAGEQVQGKDAILKMFDEVQLTKGTPTGAALRRHLEQQLNRLNSSIGRPEYMDIRPLDIIVLTDGIPTDHPKDSILSAAKEIKEKKHHPNCIGIQFVQIGKETKARAALQELSYTEEVGMVDTVPYESYGGSMTSKILERILLGGLHPNLRTILQANRTRAS